MKLRRVMAVVGLVGCLLVTAPLTASGTPSPTPQADPREVATEQAAQWLNRQFAFEYLTGPAGRPDPALTIDGTLALIAADAFPQTVIATSNWLGEEAVDFATDPISAARMALLVDAIHADPTNFGGVDLIDVMQGDHTKWAADPAALSLLIIGLDRTDLAVPNELIASLLANQQPDGSFAERGARTDAEATALAAQALGLLGHDELAAAAGARVRDWLLGNQCTTIGVGCPDVGAYWGSPSPARTAGLAIPPLASARHDMTDQVDWLMAFQNRDGGFPAAFGARESELLATSTAILGLAGFGLNNVGEIGARPAGTEPQPLESEPRSRLPLFAAGAAVVLAAGGIAIIVARRKPDEASPRKRPT